VPEGLGPLFQAWTTTSRGELVQKTSVRFFGVKNRSLPHSFCGSFCTVRLRGCPSRTCRAQGGLSLGSPPFSTMLYALVKSDCASGWWSWAWRVWGLGGPRASSFLGGATLGVCPGGVLLP
jgi:hypothetical protein